MPHRSQLRQDIDAITFPAKKWLSDILKDIRSTSNMMKGETVMHRLAPRLDKFFQELTYSDFRKHMPVTAKFKRIGPDNLSEAHNLFGYQPTYLLPYGSEDSALEAARFFTKITTGAADNIDNIDGPAEPNSQNRGIERATFIAEKIDGQYFVRTNARADTFEYIGLLGSALFHTREKMQHISMAHAEFARRMQLQRDIDDYHISAEKMRFAGHGPLNALYTKNILLHPDDLALPERMKPHWIRPVFMHRKEDYSSGHSHFDIDPKKDLVDRSTGDPEYQDLSMTSPQMFDKLYLRAFKRLASNPKNNIWAEVFSNRAITNVIANTVEFLVSVITLGTMRSRQKISSVRERAFHAQDRYTAIGITKEFDKNSRPGINCIVTFQNEKGDKHAIMARRIPRDFGKGQPGYFQHVGKDGEIEATEETMRRVIKEKIGLDINDYQKRNVRENIGYVWWQSPGGRTSARYGSVDLGTLDQDQIDSLVETLQPMNGMICASVIKLDQISFKRTKNHGHLDYYAIDQKKSVVAQKTRPITPQGRVERPKRIPRLFWCETNTTPIDTEALSQKKIYLTGGAGDMLMLDFAERADINDLNDLNIIPADTPAEP